MKFQIISITLLIYCVKCEQNLQLVWSEEFNGNEVDANVWEVEDEWQSGNCYGNFIGQLNCNVNQSKNLRLIEGCLAITAFREKQKVFDKEYTSAKIKTKMGWTYGRFEIRAALPVGKMLRPVMAMESVSPKQWATAGQIDIMSNIQTQALVSGVHFSASPPVYYGQTYGLTPETRVNQFHTYAVEWSERQMSWFFDGMRYFTFHLNHTLSPHYVRKGEPFVGKPFKLLINLGVGGLLFPNQLLDINDTNDWKDIQYRRGPDVKCRRYLPDCYVRYKYKSR
ncbi:unnamed protein product [Medioppia subpectinata]|uniref:GH16 domain-containing protein n=1 Tax=Medioppia subpectinata TaxID=1979941 RepID=A0A7R9PXD6_9ACAR|nr:unnamed protein product [Medioppia subpectinata]CAG2103885.1 unnamed protein product [Medioppia subpectinata]